MFTSVLRKGLLTSRNTIQAPFLANSMFAGMAPSACFAKYARTKPHLNVGTIGTYFSTFNHMANVSRLMAKIFPQS